MTIGGDSPRRLLSLVLLGLAVVALPTTALAGKPPKRGTTSPSGGFTKVATHPQAAAQPTAKGKTISALKECNGKLYSGYGDYGSNTGPIAVNPFDGSSFATSPELGAADTEAILGYRSIGGKLYAPSIDPRVSSDFAVGSAGSTGPSWMNPAPIHTSHAFDMATLTGSDLWLVGSSGSDAVAWRSLDGGATWAEMLRIPPASGASGDFARFYGVGVQGGKLYLQASDYYTYVQSTSKVFDGSRWSDGPSLNAPLGHSEPFAGKLLFHGNAHPGTIGPLAAFNGSTMTILQESIFDYTVDNGTVYALTTDRKVLASRDLTTWTQVGSAPSVARSIGVMGGKVYLGGTDSGIYRN